MKTTLFQETSQLALVKESLSANEGDIRHLGSILELGRSPGDRIATHSSILFQRIPWTEEPGGLQSVGPLRVGHD